MELERKPQSGQIWRHFKGNTYRIIFCTGRKASPQELYELPGVRNCKHSETNEAVFPYLKINLINGNDLVLRTLSGDLILDPHVIYQQHIPNVFSTSDNPDYLQIWARPLDNFLEVISSPYIKGVADNNYPRFARIS